ncbi:hypothetical protein BGAL_0368g00010 [Botrytis galanthina]|uniref:Uncharacterized protein n=1 Tax=Botrytis galanthina TaxID=278940 RepID=A0A4S8QS48_9HELO|nr:hypothetical protein BGAL_0368g00010 [Botrytis galanthina]
MMQRKENERSRMTHAKRPKNDAALENPMGQKTKRSSQAEKQKLKDQDQLTSFIEMANFEIKPAKANFDPVRMKCPCTGSDLGLDLESEELPVLKGEPEGDNWGP